MRPDIVGGIGDDLELGDPPIARALFRSTAGSWLWLPIRVYVGFQWFEAARAQFLDPRWVLDGSALLAFWEEAVASDTQTMSYEWYRAFLEMLIRAHAEVLLARLVVFGELAVGVALIVGAFVGIAAFFGALMNMNFMLAGTTSSNPLLFLAAVGLMLAWRVAGYQGLDRFLLPTLGVPWSPVSSSDPPRRL